MQLQNKQFGNYQLISLIGRGGMSEVWLANQLTLGRQVAIKVIQEDTVEEDQSVFVARFEREARSVAKLDHPNILSVIEYGNADGYLYLVMPYVRDGSLQDKMRQAPLTRAEAFAIFERILDGLSYAHRSGIVHRDLKPANILLYPDGRPVIADFGVAKTLNETTNLTQVGTTVGSPDYMAPEQFMGHADYRSDLYSMGVILFCMLTGKTLYSGSSAWEIGLHHMNTPLPIPNPSVPPALEAFLLKALSKRPTDRFTNADEMGAAFNEAIRQLAPGELHERPQETISKISSKKQPLPNLAAQPPASPVTQLPRSNGYPTPNQPAPVTPSPAINSVSATPVEPVRRQENLPLKPVADNQAVPTTLKDETTVPLPPTYQVARNQPANPGWPESLNEQAAKNLDEQATAVFFPSVDLVRPANPAPVQPQMPPAYHNEFRAAYPPAYQPVPPQPLPNAPKTKSFPLLLVLGIVGVLVAVAVVLVVVLANSGSKPRTDGGALFPTVAANPTSPVATTADTANPTAAATVPPTATTGPSAKIALNGHSGTVNTVNWSSDGNFYVTASDDKTLKIWDATTNQVVRTLDDKNSPNKDRVLAGVWSNNGNYILSGSADKFVHLYDTKTGLVLISAAGDTIPKAVAISPDQTLLTYTGAKVTHTWSLKDDNYGPDFPFYDANQPNVSVTALAFSPDSKYLGVGLSNGRIQVWDVAAVKLQLVAEATLAQNPATSLLWTPDGKQLIVGREKSFEIYQINIASGFVVGTPVNQTIKAPVSTLMLNAGGKQLAVGNQNGDVEIWSLDENKVITQFSSGTAPVIGLHWVTGKDQLTVASGGSQPGLVTYPVTAAATANIKVNILPQAGSKVNGTVVITDMGKGKVSVVAIISGLTPGIHHAHIHSGSCLAQGEIKYPLNDLTAGADGKASSTTTLNVDFANVTTGNHLYINIHDDPGTPTYVAGCANI